MRSAAIFLLIHVPSGCAIGAQRKPRLVHSIHATQKISSTYPKPANHGAGFLFISPARDLALASPPEPQQTAARCAAPSPSRRVARSLLAGGGRPSGFRPGRRRSASRRGLAATGPFARG